MGTQVDCRSSAKNGAGTAVCSCASFSMAVGTRESVMEPI